MYRLTFAALAVCVFAASSARAQEPDVANGRYMYFAGGCASCHAAPASDKCDEPSYEDAVAPVGGRCLKTPFGTFNVPNITPDQQTGLGGWSEDDFIRAMTEGTSPDGANYYPAFPYTSYRRMQREDLRDLWAFLKTLEPVSASVPGHDLSFPYNIRFGLTFWKMLYLDGEAFTPDPSKSAAVNRGAYLVDGPGHCGECHTPRNFLGAKDESQKFAGAAAAEGEGYVPNITPHETGIGSWSESDIVFALETGFLPDGDVIGGNMAAVQKNMAQLTKEDRDAIAAYLKSLPAIPSNRPAAD